MLRTAARAAPRYPLGCGLLGAQRLERGAQIGKRPIASLILELEFHSTFPCRKTIG